MVREKVELTRVVEEAGVVRPSGGQGSHLLADLAEASALAMVPVGLAEVRAGDTVHCLPILGHHRDRG